MVKRIVKVIVAVALGLSLSIADEIDKEQHNRMKGEIINLIKELAEPFDLVETITVIARIESNFGLYVVNLKEGSCGITQINISTFVARHKIKDTNFNRNKACSDLVNSYELSIANSIEELVYWKQQFCKKGKCSPAQYQNVVRAYNGGFKGYRGKQTAEYWDKFKTFHKELFPPKTKAERVKARVKDRLNKVAGN